jgi:hypothetical protein
MIAAAAGEVTIRCPAGEGAIYGHVAVLTLLFHEILDQTRDSFVTFVVETPPLALP